ncbi:hypothetical protein [Frankia sp. R82]|uniref:hypothetical protein n=1 Tax=Frankia sp. R82 TaxID=2950553 RepID=UPI002042F537|nr:hypothetical protein [Frankia sp. R82]MCM3882137.1 hypothetical protein [Frankia sp. R82]
MLAAAAFGVAPVGQLFGPEVHAADEHGLSADQVGRLAVECAAYTQGSDTALRRMAALSARIATVAYTRSSEPDWDGNGDEVAALLDEHAREYRALLGVWHERLVSGLAVLSDEQVDSVASRRAAWMVRTVTSIQGVAPAGPVRRTLTDAST